jgi:spermidine synthase
MTAKMILPTFGGAPQVWNTALVFFQGVLLLGYLYAHLTARRLSRKTHPWVHLAIAAAAIVALPISLHTAWFAHVQSWAAEDKPPVPLVLLALTGLIGLPFFALSANSSTLQRWYSISGRPDAAAPWFLYSAGNVGSMLALLAYPTVIEPTLTLTEQGKLWSFGYLALLALLAACALAISKAPVASEATEPNEVAEAAMAIPAEEETAAPAAAPDRKTKLTWLALAAVPSSLLLGVTTYLTSNIAPIPLLWVVPLALYLLTFILVFARRPKAPARFLGRIYPLVLTPLVVLIVLESTLPIIGLAHLAVFFIACWMCHSRLAQMKPSPEYLTEFYFYISLGGVLGGAFNALVAPLVFQTLAEYPIALVAAALLIPKPKRVDIRPLLDFGYPIALGIVMFVLVLTARAHGLEAGPTRTFLTIGLPAILCFLAVDSPLRFGLSIGAGFFIAAVTHVSSDGTVPFTARSFFGVHRIVLKDHGRFHQLINGNTIHGVEDMQHPNVPLTYYYPTGPIGQIMNEKPPKTAAFVGLGIGSLAAYGHAGQQFTYYEIDPVVRMVASDPKWFRFLHDSKANVNVVLGDARLELAKSPNSYDLIVLDAFSSDAIPIHLLTLEAIQMYLRHLNKDGLLAFHISNRFLDLEPILATAAHHSHLYVFSQDGAMVQSEKDAGAQDSIWVIMSRTEQAFQKIKIAWWSELDANKDRPWTDDYSDVIEAFNPDR